VTWLHHTLLRLLPRDRRDRYGADISRVFAEQRASATVTERITLWAKETGAILLVAIRERWPRRHRHSRSARRGWSADAGSVLRQLRRSPGHALATILCLGVGIAATISVYSILNTLLFGPLPGIEDRSTVSRVFFRSPVHGAWMNALRPEQFDLLRAHGPSIASIAGHIAQTFPVRVGGEVINARGGFVSGDYFKTFGTSPVTGRLLTPEDEAAREPSIVVGERFWRLHLGGSDDVPGRVVTIAGRDLRIVGVAPSGFPGFDISGLSEGWTAPEVWLPLSLARGWPGRVEDELSIGVAVRHAAGAERADVVRHLRVSAAQFGVVGTFGKPDPAAVPLGQGPNDSPAEIAGIIALMLAGPFSLLAIGCANVANLQLARSLERTRELSVRLSLGATRARIVRLLALESAILAIGAVGAAWLAVHVLLRYVSGVFPLPIQTDGRVLAVAAMLALIACLFSGVAPAWLVASRLQLAGLKQTPQSGARPHARLRNTLVAVQVALSLTLLVVSALLGRTFLGIAERIPSHAGEVLLANINLEQSPSLDGAAAARLARELVDLVAADPRVKAAGISSNPDIFAREEWRYLNPGDHAEVRQFARVQQVSPGYFDAVGAAPITGRTLKGSDTGTGAIVVNAELSRLLEADGRPAVGRTLTLKRLIVRRGQVEIPPVTAQIVGVVPNGFQRPDRPEPDRDVYMLLGPSLPLEFSLYLRADDASALGAPLRQALSSLEPRGSSIEVTTVLERLNRESSPIRYLGLAAGGLGMVALLLAMAGLYAVVAYVVSLRTREIGVRMAIGATRADIARLVVRQAARLVAVGTLTGLALTLPLTYALRAMFIGVSPFDPMAFIPMMIALAAVSVLASIVPARRAAGIDPVSAIRAD
jgi:putative ABC transport system permease protein